VRRVKAAGKKIGSHAARLLLEISGRDLRSLSSEIEKLATYVGEREMIEKEDVEKLASSGEIISFSLLNALREKNLSRALEVYAGLVRNKEEAVPLLALLATQFRMLLQVKSLQNRRMDSYAIAKELKSSPFFVKKSLEAASHFSLEELLQSLDLLHEADIKLRSGENQTGIMELLFAELCKK
jgi:DNA polymerase-3 subunit delta